MKRKFHLVKPVFMSEDEKSGKKKEAIKVRRFDLNCIFYLFTENAVYLLFFRNPYNIESDAGRADKQLSTAHQLLE
jgi:hypothetical protein